MLPYGKNEDRLVRFNAPVPPATKREFEPPPSPIN